MPLISLKCSLRFPDNFHKIRHNGVVKGVGGAWRRVEPIGGYTKGGAYRGGRERGVIFHPFAMHCAQGRGLYP